MKKLILSLCIILALSACKDENEPKEQTKPVVRIGATLPLTGGFSETGNSAKQALLIAFEKWQQKDMKYRYELFVEDDAKEIKVKNNSIYYVKDDSIYRYNKYGKVKLITRNELKYNYENVFDVYIK